MQITNEEINIAIDEFIGLNNIFLNKDMLRKTLQDNIILYKLDFKQVHTFLKNLENVQKLNRRSIIEELENVKNPLILNIKASKNILKIIDTLDLTTKLRLKQSTITEEKENIIIQPTKLSLFFVQKSVYELSKAFKKKIIIKES